MDRKEENKPDEIPETNKVDDLKDNANVSEK